MVAARIQVEIWKKAENFKKKQHKTTPMLIGSLGLFVFHKRGSFKLSELFYLYTVKRGSYETPMFMQTRKKNTQHGCTLSTDQTGIIY